MLVFVLSWIAAATLTLLCAVVLDPIGNFLKTLQRYDEADNVTVSLPNNIVVHLWILFYKPKSATHANGSLVLIC